MNLNHITVNTQSSIRIAGSKVLYFDPFKVEIALHDADIIFITHEHYDHFEPESIAKVKKEDTLLVTPESMKKKVLSESGVSAENCVFYNPGETHKLDNVVIETIPAYNKMKPFHPKGKKWQGYVVKMDDVRYYVAGDTDVNEDIQKVECDVAIIPIGGHYTMDKKQAADYIAGLEQKPQAVIPTHYGSIIGKPGDGSDFQGYLNTADKNIQVELKL
ncbi:MAG: MBL fold metallo-hydrolase [Bacillus sp. (in: Bacteria)]|nr:MBL fold metallo-hydrolase [Bacillus sp. (in: firmicutes)]MCM1426489.1 MBL fold metallo-hydrolase [Eubacterium sp.]